MKNLTTLLLILPTLYAGHAVADHHCTLHHDKAGDAVCDLKAPGKDKFETSCQVGHKHARVNETCGFSGDKSHCSFKADEEKWDVNCNGRRDTKKHTDHDCRLTVTGKDGKKIVDNEPVKVGCDPKQVKKRLQ